MADPKSSTPKTFAPPTWLLIVAGAVVFVATLCGVIADTAFALAVLATATVEGIFCLAMAVAAGGFGYLLIGRLKLTGAPGGLKVLTAVGLGLWLLQTLLLAVGSLTSGLLTPYLWWPIIVAGVALAIWQARGAMAAWRMPKASSAAGLLWLLAPAAVAMWIAGAMRAPGLIGVVQGDFYDVLEYHLQVPREFYLAGHIGLLMHNCYSFYPLGCEMLYLLSMILRGGPYEGMYLAKMTHGLYGVLAVAAAYCSLRGTRRTPAVWAALLLASVPALLYISWVAKTELAQVFALALAAGWLRHWLQKPALGPAVCIGVSLGAACATKYLAVGFIALPVLGAMFIACLRDRKRVAGILIAGFVTLALFAPWLVRNAALVGNPIFPLASTSLGSGYWTTMEQQRWNDGTSRAAHPPVPPPMGYEMPTPPSAAAQFVDNLIRSKAFGGIRLLLAAAMIVLLAAKVMRKDVDDGWAWALAGIAAMQLGVWLAVARDLPWRFLLPMAVPVCLLAAGFLDRLAQAQFLSTKRKGAKPQPWGAVLATILLISIVVLGLSTGHRFYEDETIRFRNYPPIPPGEAMADSTLQEARLPLKCRLMLIGEAKAFYFPPGTVYATAFDPHPLAMMVREGLSDREILKRLRAMGVTHLYVNWSELMRLSATYGYAPELSADLYDAWEHGGLPRLAILDRLAGVGMREHARFGEFGARPFWMKDGPILKWPAVTVYRLPIGD